MRMTPEAITAERRKMNDRAKTNVLAQRVTALESYDRALAARLDVMQSNITALDMRGARQHVRIQELETRIKQLEAVVYADGEPEGHGLVEDVQ